MQWNTKKNSNYTRKPEWWPVADEVWAMQKKKYFQRDMWFINAGPVHVCFGWPMGTRMSVKQDFYGAIFHPNTQSSGYLAVCRFSRMRRHMISGCWLGWNMFSLLRCMVEGIILRFMLHYLSKMQRNNGLGHHCTCMAPKIGRKQGKNIYIEDVPAAISSVRSSKIGASAL